MSDEKNLVRDLTIEVAKAKDERDKAQAEIKSLLFFHQEKENSLNNKLKVLQSKLLKSD